MNSNRMKRLQELMEKHEFEIIALNPGPTLYYLTGLSFHLMERPVVLFVQQNGPSSIVLPELEEVRLADSDLDAQIFSYDENPSSQEEAFRKASKSLGSGALHIAVEPLRLRYFELEIMQRVVTEWVFCSGEDALAELRLVKGSEEVELMEKATTIAETAVQETLPHMHGGMTEREIASLLTINLLRTGSEPELPFNPIVASGPNSALPHATPTDRKLKQGDLLLLDWGARHGGYISDLTRTYALGKVDDELKEIHSIVLRANEAGRGAIAPGIPCSKVDGDARSVIDAAGYGDHFIHRTGHGIGLETHEPPYIREDNERTLIKGMTFTVEPGIYLPGKGGVRIEDDIVVTEDGGRSLSTLPRELEVIA